MDGQSVGAVDSVATADEFADQDSYDKDSTYWALWRGEDLASALDDKQRAYFETARNRGLVNLWIVAYAAHHGVTPEDLRDFSTQQIAFQGVDLELIRFHLNLTRSYNRHAAIMALGEDPAFKAMVVNSDHQSQARAELADKIVNGLYKRYSAKFDTKVAEGDGFVGLCSTHYRWDFKSGDKVTVERPVTLPNGLTGSHPMKVKSGAPVVTVVYPWAQIQETRASGEKLWVLIRETESKWNLIGQYPHLRDAILNQTVDQDDYDFGRLFRLEELEFANKDLIVVKHFYHARCAAVPEGRYVIMVGSVVLWDGPCPTEEGLPIAEMCSATFVETNFGYCDGWDLLSVNQALNQLNSDELQNYSLFAKQSTYAEKGTISNPNGLTHGTHYEIPVGAKPPGAIMLAQMPPTGPFKDYMHRMLDLISSQSSTSRGEPDPNVRSGEMAALLDSIAIRYQSYRQQAARQFRVRGAQIILDMINRYGETPFLLEIAGIEDRAYVQEFTRDDLSGIERVTIDVVSPMMQTVSGRLQLMLQLKDLDPQTRAAALDLILSGDVTSFTNPDRACNMLIRRENEDLITGARQVAVNATDDPFKHVPKHVAAREKLLSSDNQDPQALARLDQHILEHTQTYLAASPLMCGFLKITPPPAMPPSQSNEFGNPAWQFQVMTQGGPAPVDPTAGVQTGGAGQGAQPAAPEAPTSQRAQVNDSQGIPQNHPSGTPLPQPSMPAGA